MHHASQSSQYSRHTARTKKYYTSHLKTQNENLKCSINTPSVQTTTQAQINSQITPRTLHQIHNYHQNTPPQPAKRSATYSVRAAQTENPKCSICTPIHIPAKPKLKASSSSIAKSTAAAPYTPGKNTAIQRPHSSKRKPEVQHLYTLTHTPQTQTQSNSSSIHTLHNKSKSTVTTPHTPEKNPETTPCLISNYIVSSPTTMLSHSKPYTQSNQPQTRSTTSNYHKPTKALQHPTHTKSPQLSNNIASSQLLINRPNAVALSTHVKTHPHTAISVHNQNPNTQSQLKSTHHEAAPQLKSTCMHSGSEIQRHEASPSNTSYQTIAHAIRNPQTPAYTLLWNKTTTRKHLRNQNLSQTSRAANNCPHKSCTSRPTINPTNPENHQSLQITGLASNNQPKTQATVIQSQINVLANKTKLLNISQHANQPTLSSKSTSVDTASGTKNVDVHT
eukprot:gene3105-2087_t